MDAFLERVKRRKAEIRSGLSHLYLPFYDRLCNELEGTYWFPYKGLRTLEEQAELFGRGRDLASIKKGERIVTYAMAGDSPHNWGCATDWVEWRPEWNSKEIWTKSDWNFYGECCSEVGLNWGGSWKKFQDKPHNELPLKCGWVQVGDEYRKNGALWIEEFLEKKLGGKND